jgi:transcription elongation factor Elf1
MSEWIGEIYKKTPFICPRCNSAASSIVDNNGRPTNQLFYCVQCARNDSARRDQEAKLASGYKCSRCNDPIHTPRPCDLTSYSSKLASLCNKCGTLYASDEVNRKKGGFWGNFFG